MTDRYWILNQFQNLYEHLGLNEGWTETLATLTAVVVVLLLAVLANVVAKRIIVTVVNRLIVRTKAKWDDALLKWKVFHRLSHVAPALVIYYYTPGVLSDYPGWSHFFEGAAVLYMTLIGILVLDCALNAFLEIYDSYKISREVPIKGLVQVVKIVVYFIGLIILIATVVGKSPVFLLSGLGALTAVLMLIFKDPILGFVAGIQLASNKMVAVGDWIEMPKYGADGDVMEVALTTVKVRNWDKTITTLPTYALISDSFCNWRGMKESGGRRIKRAIYLDMHTIRFCTEEMLKRYSKIAYISEYLEKKMKEVDEDNRGRKLDLTSLANGRRLTNVGTFRAYLVAYLRDHPKVHQDMTFLVRQLAPTEHGLPMEVYVFSNDQVWAHYEAIQADIFDHVLAVVQEFDLRVFQRPSGADFRNFAAAPAP